MIELAYLNGSFCPIDQAKVSIEDRGFQFADGVYEVVLVHGDKAFMLEEHLQRLANSCRGINLEVDFAKLDLRATLAEGVRRAGFGNTLVYLQLTRGASSRSHVQPANYEPTVVMTFKAKPQVSAELRARGLSVVTISDFRWGRCDIKSIALLPNVMAKNDAQARGYDDAIFVGPEGDVREASAANIFIIADGHLLTKPQDHTILPGITRACVLECAECIGVPLRETRVSVDDLRQADEALLCSTTMDVISIVRVDDHPIGDGRPGPMVGKLYQEMLKQIGAADQCPSA